MCGYSFVAAPVRDGAVAVLLASLFVACGALLLLGLVLERRLLRPSVMPLAFTIGDPALAVSICLGVQITGPRQPCGIIGPHGQLAAAGLGLLFGLWQWRAEVKAGVYTWQQALSPTKLWHQLVIYPAVGTWAVVAISGGLINAWRMPFSAVLMMLGVTIWAGTCLHYLRHPRLGHPPYDWRHLRPVPPPWNEDSITLRSGAPSGTPAKLAALPGDFPPDTYVVPLDTGTVLSRPRVQEDYSKPGLSQASPQVRRLRKRSFE